MYSIIILTLAGKTKPSKDLADPKCTVIQHNNKKEVILMNNSKWLWEWLQMDYKL